MFNYLDYFAFAGITAVGCFLLVNNVLERNIEWYSYVFSAFLIVATILFVMALKPFYNNLGKLDKYFEDLDEELEELEEDDIKITKTRKKN